LSERGLPRLSRGDAHVVAVRLSRNFGHRCALTGGLIHCRGARILNIDADLQDPPEPIGQMMSLMDTGADVVYGQRRIRQGETRFKVSPPPCSSAYFAS
jgi:polyisoprenyl-phosphate glycosyltransferase